MGFLGVFIMMFLFTGGGIFFHKIAEKVLGKPEDGFTKFLFTTFTFTPMLMLGYLYIQDFQETMNPWVVFAASFVGIVAAIFTSHYTLSSLKKKN